MVKKNVIDIHRGSKERVRALDVPEGSIGYAHDLDKAPIAIVGYDTVISLDDGRSWERHIVVEFEPLPSGTRVNITV